MGKKLSAEARRLQDEARGRVNWILTNLYGGRQRRMAEESGVPQSQISRIVNGRLGVSPDVLDALARLPGVNPDWVRRGEAQPLLPATKGTLPVALCVLRGSPLDYPQMLTGHRHPVAEQLDRETRYWLEVQPGSDLVRDPRLRMCAGDMLLMETDREWTSRLEHITGKLCGVALTGHSPEPDYVLVLVSHDALGLMLDIIGGWTRSAQAASQRPLAAEEAPDQSDDPVKGTGPHQEKVVPRRKVRILEHEKQKAEARRQKAEQPAAGVRTEIQNVVCVCVYMARPLPGAALPV